MSDNTPLAGSDLYLSLNCDLLRQMAWLGAAAAGGLLVLLEAGLVPVDWISVIALVIFAAVVVASVRGQELLVDRFADGEELRPAAKRARGLAMFLMGIGAGILAAGLVVRLV